VVDHLEPLSGRKKVSLDLAEMDKKLLVCTLLKYAQFRKDAVGERWEFFYLRDKERRELDFVVTFSRCVR
jgi:hypothetical protein